MNVVLSFFRQIYLPHTRHPTITARQTGERPTRARRREKILLFYHSVVRVVFVRRKQLVVNVMQLSDFDDVILPFNVYLLLRAHPLLALPRDAHQFRKWDALLSAERHCCGGGERACARPPPPLRADRTIE